MKKTAALIMLFSAILTSADVTYYVDTGSAGGNGTTPEVTGATAAYKSLQACLAARAQDLTDNGGDVCRILCTRTNGGGMDTTAVNMNQAGWVTSATCYVEISASDFPATGIYDGTKYVINNNDAATVQCTISKNYVRLRRLQFLIKTTGTNTRRGLQLYSLDAANKIIVDSCIIKGDCAGTGEAQGIYINDADALVDIYNTQVYGFFIASDTGFMAIRSVLATTVNLWNCTIWANQTGVVRTSGTVNATNCVVFDNEDDWSGTIVADYCASDDANASTYTNGQDFTAEATDWNKIFVDYTTGNVTLLNYTTAPCCVGVGVDDAGSGAYSVDIIGTVRNSTWDIGCYEYAGGQTGAGVFFDPGFDDGFDGGAFQD